MKITKFWVVTEPTDVSTLEDILFDTNIDGLALQLKGGLSIEKQKPEIFTQQGDAMAEAERRLLAVRILRGLRQTPNVDLRAAANQLGIDVSDVPCKSKTYRTPDGQKMSIPEE
jgi:hypothetical protein